MYLKLCSVSIVIFALFTRCSFSEKVALIKFFDYNLDCQDDYDALNLFVPDECFTLGGDFSTKLKILNSTTVSQQNFARDGKCQNITQRFDYVLGMCNVPKERINSLIPKMMEYDEAYEKVVDFSKNSCRGDQESYTNFIYRKDCKEGNPVLIIMICLQKDACEGGERKCKKGVQSVLTCGEVPPLLQ